MKHLALLCLLLLAALAVPAARAAPAADDRLRVQPFLDAQPGPLKSHLDGRQPAAVIIEGASLYYGLDARLHLALLETTSSLLSDAAPPPDALRQPFGPAGPTGFAAQIEWASGELRAGLGPYASAPVLRFTDGTSATLSLNQAPEGVAVQRLLAIGRTQPAWRILAARFVQVYQLYFNNQLAAPAAPQPAVAGGFLLQPWPAGTAMYHLAYFDHTYPTVDSGGDGNGVVTTYWGGGGVQYNTHDGHDFFFPAQPIGTPILAAAPGLAYARTLRGNGVVVRHASGYETVYWHLSAFAPLFDGLVDAEGGVPVAAGALLGYSGRSGFVGGTPHLHFEVRHNGREVDSYGWYGAGDDPCAAYAGCERSQWLWSDALRGSYDFTPPDAALAVPDTAPPVATLSVNPRPDLLLLARFDGGVVPEVGGGQPFAAGEQPFAEGRYGQSLQAGSVALTFPTDDNLRLVSGTLSLWARLPSSYPATSTGRHYLFAASANADDPARVYSGTLALRREADASGARWNFWTVPDTAAPSPLVDAPTSAPDVLAPGWHHFAIAWDAAAGTKALYLDGTLAARAEGVTLPADVGPLLQLGRFSSGGAGFGGSLDDLAIFGRALAADEIAAIAQSNAPISAGDGRVVGASAGPAGLRVDTNASDAGGIMAMEIGVDGVWGDPRPYDEALDVELPRVAGPHTVAARYSDAAGNTTTVSASVLLDLPPVGSARIAANDGLRATLLLSATDALPDLAMQLSPLPDFAFAEWQPFRPAADWGWGPVRRRIVYVRFRDASGLVSAPLALSPDGATLWLPLVQQGATSR